MPLDEAYLRWLYSQVGSAESRNKATSYWVLLRLLYLKEFTWTIPKDQNRATNAKNLRTQFLRETGTKLSKHDREWLDMPASVLEVLLDLAFVLAFEGGGELHERFWELIGNLGLAECTDANPPEDHLVDHIIDKVMERDYAANGAGGFFPLTNMNGQQDQREVELWYQAQAYLLERM